MTTNPRVAVIMGSDSDWPVMKAAVDVLQEAGVEVIYDIVSAHRTPEKMTAFAQGAREQGLQVVIAGAGGAAHLPGMVAASTTLPVIGVPIPLKHLEGMDSLLSIVQMPNGVPVATVGIAQAKNAGLLALRMLAITDTDIAAWVDRFAEQQSAAVLDKKLGD
mgnify:FL=1|tara:strand:+ start:96 stop:581 length:486 start_codon:yes stop_codon:yes gene_type:complete